MERKPRVLVAMSGGVDSSVAAALLVDQGYDVVGATMQVWDYSNCDITDGQGTCCSSMDVDDARAVADRIGIPFYVINCEEQFKKAVIDPFLQSYMNAETPLPCVNCNTYLKFDHLIKKMNELNCDYLATGHYAQIVKGLSGQPAIKTSADTWKDQTYFLFTIPQEIVPKILFPIGHLNKTEVRKIALEKDLVVAKKKDSQGICFVGDKGYKVFLDEHLSPEQKKSKQGVIKRYPSGELLGPHDGIFNFTIGQSKGLGLDHHEKLFVIKIDSMTNTVFVGDESNLYSKTVTGVNPHWLDQIESGTVVDAKIRYQQGTAKAVIRFEGEKFTLDFEEPQRAVTSGQAVVLYRDKQLLGGGWIKA